jgi:hypothetical protein
MNSYTALHSEGGKEFQPPNKHTMILQLLGDLGLLLIAPSAALIYIF